MSWIWISFSKKSKDLNLIFCTLGECPTQVKGLSMTKLYLDCTLILTKFKIRLKSGWSEVLKIRIDFFHIFPNTYFYLDKIKTKMQLGKFFLSFFFSKYSNGIFGQNGASTPLKIYVTCRYNWSNYLEGNSWLIKRINFLWRWLPLSLPFQRYSGTGPDLLLGFGWFGGKPIVGFTEPIIGFTCGSLFELLFGFYLKFYK